MFNFSSFIQYLEEAKKKKSKENDEGEGSSQNSAGVLHELLTGYHLNNGRHMDKHEDIDGLSPRQAHDKIKASMDPETYSDIYRKAKFAAEDIRKRVGGKIARVHWTSKPGDIKRSTGIESTQKQDPSDIMVTTEDGKHHGISLKVSKNTEHVPIANPGIEALHGADHLLQKHRENVTEKYPQLVGVVGGGKARKAIVRADSNMENDVRTMNRSTLSAMSAHLASKLSQMSPEEIVHHLRGNVLHAHATPLQEAGHVHMRHTIWGEGDNLKAKSIDPSQHYEHLLQSPEHITVRSTGQGVTFYHKDVPFARQNIKFDSQSDPLSSVKSATQDIPPPKVKSTTGKTSKSKKTPVPTSASEPTPAAQPPTSPMNPKRNPSTRFSTIKAASGDWRTNQTNSQNLAGSMSHGSNFYSDSDRAEFSKGFN
jgi:hypothetical protein